MTDFLAEFSDDDLIDTSLYAAQTALAMHDDDSQTGYLLRGIAEGLAVLQHRRNLPTNVVLWAAQERFAGVITQAEFVDIVARETLRFEGVAEPTIDQIAYRVAELKTAGSFIESIRGQ
jgi:hypothetical protein